MKLPRRAGTAPVQDALLARRSFLTLAAIAVASPTAPALASIASLRDQQFGYTLSYPDDWVPAPKPVKTHLSESLLQSPIRGVSLGVTVDPVKINSLTQFGTAEQASQSLTAHTIVSRILLEDTAPARVTQVAARVLDTELTRDGVKDVFLRKVRGTAADEWFLGALQPCCSRVGLASQATSLIPGAPTRCRALLA